jgi:hypothetical protein
MFDPMDEGFAGLDDVANTPVWIWFAAAALAIALPGCATHPAPTPAPQVVCLPLRSYTKAQQQQAATELAKLPQSSELAQMVVDYGAMRDADRACQSSK